MRTGKWEIIVILVVATIVVALWALWISELNKKTLSNTIYCKSKQMVLLETAGGEHACVPGEYIK